MVSKKSSNGAQVRAQLVKEIPRVDGGLFAMHPVTKGMVEKVGKLKAGQIVKFKLPNKHAADNRADSLRDLRKKKRVSFSRLVQRGVEIYVEK